MVKIIYFKSPVAGANFSIQDEEVKFFNGSITSSGLNFSLEGSFTGVAIHERVSDEGEEELTISCSPERISPLNAIQAKFAQFANRSITPGILQLSDKSAAAMLYSEELSSEVFQNAQEDESKIILSEIELPGIPGKHQIEIFETIPNKGAKFVLLDAAGVAR